MLSEPHQIVEMCSAEAAAYWKHRNNIKRNPVLKRDRNGGLMEQLIGVLAVVFVISYLGAKFWTYHEETNKRGGTGD